MDALKKTISGAVQTREALAVCCEALKLCIDRLEEVGGPEARHAIKKAKEAVEAAKGVGT